MPSVTPGFRSLRRAGLLVAALLLAAAAPPAADARLSPALARLSAAQPGQRVVA